MYQITVKGPDDRATIRSIRALCKILKRTYGLTVIQAKPITEDEKDVDCKRGSACRET